MQQAQHRSRLQKRKKRCRNLEGLEKPSEKDDFYFASNYDWLTTAVIAPGKSSVNAFNEVKDGTDKRAINLLENSTETDHNTELVQTLYKTILDWDSRNALGTEPAEKALEAIKNISSIDELSDFITDPDASFSVTTLLALAVDASMNDSSKYTVWVGCEDFLLEDAAEYSERTDYGQRRYDSVLYLLEHMLPRLGYTEADAQPMLDQAIDFEAKIAEAAYTSADRMSPDYVSRINNVMTPEELKELSPVFPLFRLAEGYGFDAAKEFQVDNPEHIKRVNEVYTEENLDAIKALLMITCIRKLAPMMDKDSYDVHVEANNIKSGASGSQPIETVAFDAVRKILYGPMDQAYLAMYDYSKTKEEVVELIHEIIDHYRSMLEQEDWLTEDTRKKAIELWQTRIPAGNREQLARLIFCVENPPGTKTVSGSQVYSMEGLVPNLRNSLQYLEMICALGPMVGEQNSSSGLGWRFLQAVRLIKMRRRNPALTGTLIPLVLSISCFR